MSGIYVHIPYCSSRCIYCGFFSTTGRRDQKEYIESVIKELRMRTTSMFYRPKTIYFGGGTPSVLSTSCLDLLVDGIQSYVDTSHVTEWTIECNPDDVTEEMAEWLKGSPINRVSMGVQTFSDERLTWLRRRHRASQVFTAVERLRKFGIENISLDMIFGFPEQTLQEWEKDISECLSLKPEHISAYSLMFEEGTPLLSMLQRGEIKEIADTLSLQMYNRLIDTLSSEGYRHYEISNFALPDHESCHNSSYWHQIPYLGLGAAAHSYNGEKRWWNVSDIQRYIDSLKTGMPEGEEEIITEQVRYNDIITTSLRTSDGITLSEIPHKYRSYLLHHAERHILEGRMEYHHNSLRLSRNGIFISDDIMSDLIYI